MCRCRLQQHHQNTDVFGRLKWSWPERSGRNRRNTYSGLILNGGNGGNCLRCPWSLPWCPFKSPNTNLQSTKYQACLFSCLAHFELTCFERGLYSQFGVAYKAMLLPDAIPTIGWKGSNEEKRCFLKRGRLRVSGHLVILPCITQSTSGQNKPCSPFQCSRHENMPWFSTLIKHRVWLYILARQT